MNESINDYDFINKLEKNGCTVRKEECLILLPTELGSDFQKILSLITPIITNAGYMAQAMDMKNPSRDEKNRVKIFLTKVLK